MNFDTAIAGAVPSLLLLALGWHVNRVQRDRDALAAGQVARIYELEKHAESCFAKFHELDVRQSKSETAADGVAGQLDDLRAYLDERFNALNQRIDDVLRGPPPARKRG